MINLEDVDLYSLITTLDMDTAVKQVRKLKSLSFEEARELIENAHHALKVGGLVAVQNMSTGVFETLKGGLGKALAGTVLPGERVIASLEGVSGQGIALTDSRVIIVKAGAASGAMFGQKGKAYTLADITSVEFSCAVTQGRIQITVAGSHENRSGVLGRGQSILDQAAASMQAENICQFPSTKKAQFQSLSSLIQHAIQEKKQAASTGRVNGMSIPDQIRQLKELADQDIITQEEFQSKKTELLSKM